MLRTSSLKQRSDDREAPEKCPLWPAFCAGPAPDSVCSEPLVDTCDHSAACGNVCDDLGNVYSCNDAPHSTKSIQIVRPQHVQWYLFTPNPDFEHLRDIDGGVLVAGGDTSVADDKLGVAETVEMDTCGDAVFVECFPGVAARYSVAQAGLPVAVADASVSPPADRVGLPPIRSPEIHCPYPVQGRGIPTTRTSPTNYPEIANEITRKTSE